MNYYLNSSLIVIGICTCGRCWVFTQQVRHKPNIWLHSSGFSALVTGSNLTLCPITLCITYALRHSEGSVGDDVTSRNFNCLNVMKSSGR